MHGRKNIKLENLRILHIEELHNLYASPNVCVFEKK